MYIDKHYSSQENIQSFVEGPHVEHQYQVGFVHLGKVSMKRHVRRSKFEPLVDEVDLLEATPQYAHVRLSSGKETTVSLHDLSPREKEGTTVLFPMKMRFQLKLNMTQRE